MMPTDGVDVIPRIKGSFQSVTDRNIPMKGVTLSQTVVKLTGYGKAQYWSGPVLDIRRAMRLTLRWVIAMSLVWLFPWAQAASDDSARPIAVLYPDIGEPYRSVFAAILEGISDRARGKTVSFAISNAGNSSDLVADLKKRDSKVVIALGRNGLRAASGLDKTISVMAAGVLSVPESEAQNFSVQSLAPDPALLFARLRSLVPGAKRVTVIFDPRQNNWLIRLAREAARAHGLELQAREAGDLKSALKLYQDTLASADPKQDVLWLAQDSTTVDDATVLPLVLQEAWNQNLTVFSSNVTHVKRGVLFSLYPDNLELGRALGLWAMNALGTAQSNTGIIPLRQVLMAVNTRTAAHLGVNLNSGGHRISMVFPEP